MNNRVNEALMGFQSLPVCAIKRLRTLMGGCAVLETHVWIIGAVAEDYSIINGLLELTQTNTCINLKPSTWV